MASLNIIILTVGIISSFLIQAQGADKYTDGNRPYEFGFNIDGEQHRHEKKDEKGLIMGEFGFITADGVYHVTVYATDEQGRFKILSMKNIRVKPYPTYNKQAGTARQGHALDLQNPQQTIPQAVSPTQKPELPTREILIEKPGRSCSSCSLPTTTTPAPKPEFIQPNVQNIPFGSNANKFAQNPASVNPQYFQETKTNSFSNQQNDFSDKNEGLAPSFLANKQNQLKHSQISSQQVPGSLPNVPAVNQNFDPQTLPDQGLVAPKQDTSNYPDINSPQTYVQKPLLPQSNSQPIVSNFPTTIPNYSVEHPEVPQEYPSGLQSSYPQNGVGQNIASDQPQGFGPSVQSVQNNAGHRTAKTYNGEPQQLLVSQGAQPNGPNAQSGFNVNSGGRTAKKYDGESQQTLGSQGNQPSGNEAGLNREQTLPKKPILISAQMQIVDKNTNIHQRGPGEKEGLPDGLSKDDMTQLLYTFNYTVGFHGHFEEGYTNGAKQGYYYITGRNGVRTRVDYVADEKGFRPKITQEVLDLLSEDVPKPETEKDEKYGLKGYEFKWLYFPVKTQGR